MNLLCKIFGHKWNKRNCLRKGCLAESILSYDKYGVYLKAGRPLFLWETINWNKICGK